MDRKALLLTGVRRNTSLWYISIPFIYLFCNANDQPPNDQDSLDGVTETMTWNAPLTGDIFNGADKYKLFQLLVAQKASSGSSGSSKQTLVNRFSQYSDGQVAWLNLVLTNEVTNYHNACILKAEEMKPKRSDRQRWTLADYCSVHMNVQAELETLVIICDGASQVRALLVRIQTNRICQMFAIALNDDLCATNLQASAVIKLQNLICIRLASTI